MPNTHSATKSVLEVAKCYFYEMLFYDMVFLTNSVLLFSVFVKCRSLHQVRPYIILRLLWRLKKGQYTCDQPAICYITEKNTKLATLVN